LQARSESTTIHFARYILAGFGGAHALAVIVLIASAEARIRGIVIDKRETAAYKGQSFGEAGRYEWIRGTAYGEIDPKEPLNAIITDIQFAPKNARRFVEYSATFTLAKPVEMSKSSGALLYDVANRARNSAGDVVHTPKPQDIWLYIFEKVY